MAHLADHWVASAQRCAGNFGPSAVTLDGADASIIPARIFPCSFIWHILSRYPHPYSPSASSNSIDTVPIRPSIVVLGGTSGRMTHPELVRLVDVLPACPASLARTVLYCPNWDQKWPSIHHPTRPPRMLRATHTRSSQGYSYPSTKPSFRTRLHGHLHVETIVLLVQFLS